MFEGMKHNCAKSLLHEAYVDESNFKQLRSAKANNHFPFSANRINLGTGPCF